MCHRDIDSYPCVFRLNYSCGRFPTFLFSLCTKVAVQPSVSCRCAHPISPASCLVCWLHAQPPLNFRSLHPTLKGIRDLSFSAVWCPQVLFSSALSNPRALRWSYCPGSYHTGLSSLDRIILQLVSISHKNSVSPANLRLKLTSKLFR